MVTNLPSRSVGLRLVVLSAATRNIVIRRRKTQRINPETSPRAAQAAIAASCAGKQQADFGPVGGSELNEFNGVNTTLTRLRFRYVTLRTPTSFRCITLWEATVLSRASKTFPKLFRRAMPSVRGRVCGRGKSCRRTLRQRGAESKNRLNHTTFCQLRSQHSAPDYGLIRQRPVILLIRS